MLKKLIKYLKIEAELEGFKPILLMFFARDYFLARHGSRYTWIEKEIDGELVGYCIMREDCIFRIAVDKSHQRKGIGKSLVPKYARLVNTSTADGFYKKLGFEKIGGTWMARDVLSSKSNTKNEI